MQTFKKLELIKKTRNINKQNFLMDFENLKISSITIQTLGELGFKKMTRIQKISIPPALKMLDVLGSARTGSGKTLCFVIPIIENLFLLKWTKIDPPGGCILCPIRELAIQIYDFTKNLSKKHLFNTGILIGGNKYKKEQHFSVIISTPGCLFHHVIVHKNLNCDSIKILAIDEADKILDLSFWKITNFLNQILPKKKQILLFSATLNSKIRNIARLNLKFPVFCCLKKVQSQENFSLLYENQPIKHFVLFSSFEEKLNMLYSFLKSHKMQKIIIFLTTKSQVKFISEIFKNINSDFLVFYIYGSMNQHKRVNNFIKFNHSTKGFLFSTDLSSRGLDFKSIDWIVQLDCPQNIETYIHRSGRTGRFLESGKTILFLYYQESKFVEVLNENSIKTHVVKISQKHFLSIQSKIEVLIKRSKKIMILAQNAFISYAKFIFLQKNKKFSDFKIFNWNKIALNFGLNSSFL